MSSCIEIAYAAALVGWFAKLPLRMQLHSYVRSWFVKLRSRKQLQNVWNFGNFLRKTVLYMYSQISQD